MRGMERYRIPSGVAIALVVVLILGVLTVGGLLVGNSIGEFTDRMPFYQQRLNEKLTELATGFGQQVTVEELLRSVQPGAAMAFAGDLLTGLRGLLANVFLIIFTVIFLLLEASSLPARITAVLSAARADPDYLRRFTDGVQRYLGIKTLISVVTGAAAGMLAAAMGLDFPILWGMLAFLLNYIPNIGSFIAAVPAVMLALIQFDIAQASIVALGYLAINVAIGGIIEPRIMGRGLGLSALVVFLSLVFWGWVFGPVGMLLSVPLTMTAKIALEASESAAHLAVLLGPADRALTEEPEEESGRAAP